VRRWALRVQARLAEVCCGFYLQPTMPTAHGACLLPCYLDLWPAMVSWSMMYCDAVSRISTATSTLGEQVGFEDGQGADGVVERNLFHAKLLAMGTEGEGQYLAE